MQSCLCLFIVLNSTTRYDRVYAPAGTL